VDGNGASGHAGRYGVLHSWVDLDANTSVGGLSNHYRYTVHAQATRRSDIFAFAIDCPAGESLRTEYDIQQLKLTWRMSCVDAEVVLTGYKTHSCQRIGCFPVSRCGTAYQCDSQTISVSGVEVHAGSEATLGGDVGAALLGSSVAHHTLTGSASNIDTVTSLAAAILDYVVAPGDAYIWIGFKPNPLIHTIAELISLKATPTYYDYEQFGYANPAGIALIKLAMVDSGSVETTLWTAGVPLRP
jgi:hypothetical protein